MTVDERVAQGFHVRFLLTSGSRRRAWVPRQMLTDVRYGFVAELGVVQPTDGGASLDPATTIQLVRALDRSLQQGNERRIPSRSPTAPLGRAAAEVIERSPPRSRPRTDGPTIPLGNTAELGDRHRRPAVAPSFDLSEAPTRVLRRTEQVGLMVQLAGLPTQPRSAPGPAPRESHRARAWGLLTLLYGILLLWAAGMVCLVVLTVGVLSL